MSCDLGIERFVLYCIVWRYDELRM